MAPQAELPAAFDCHATAAILRSGTSASLAGHVAAVLAMLAISKGGPAAWIAFSSLAVWSLGIYLAIRVQIDARFFDLIALHPAERLDLFLAAAGLRKQIPSRTISERRRGALRLWRALLFAVALQVALVLLAIVFCLL